jgi:carboxylate-amine ligase
VGVELELQIVDAQTLDLRDGILPIMERLRDSPYVRPELMQESVEVGSRVCHSAAEIEFHLGEVCEILHEEAAKLGMALCGMGTHPFCRRLAMITPEPRYERLAAGSGYLAQTQQTFATHVHVGVRSGEEAMRAMRAMRPYLPILLALAANSPYWQGHETDCASYRHRILAASRSYGIPPAFDSWDHFSAFYRSTERAGLFASVKDIHWDIRPQPKLGTIEVRIMDAPSDIRQVAELAALIRAIVVHVVRDDRVHALPTPLPWWSERENHFQAARRGLDAVYICHPNGSTMPLREVCETVIGSMMADAAVLGDRAYLETLQTGLLARPGYFVQRETLKRRGGHLAVVEERIADFTASIARASLGLANAS